MPKSKTEIVRESNKRRLKHFSFLLPPDIVDAFKITVENNGKSQREALISLLKSYIDEKSKEQEENEKNWT